MTIAKRLREQGRQEGRLEGMQQGLQKGEWRTKKEIATRLLQEEKDLHFISRSTGLSLQEIDALIKEISTTH